MSEYLLDHGFSAIPVDPVAGGSAAEANLTHVKAWMGPALTSNDGGKRFAFADGSDGWIREGGYSKGNANPPEVGRWDAVTAATGSTAIRRANRLLSTS